MCRVQSVYEKHPEVLFMKIVRYLRRKVFKYLDRSFCIYLWVYKDAMYRVHRFAIPFPCQTGNPFLSIDLFHPEPNLTDSIPPIHLVVLFDSYFQFSTSKKLSLFIQIISIKSCVFPRSDHTYFSNHSHR